MLPSSREGQQTCKNCFCLTVRGHSTTFPDSQEEALGQAGKTRSQIAGWPERSEGHRGLSDCPPNKVRVLHWNDFPRAALTAPTAWACPRAQCWKAWWVQGKLREFDEI